MEENRNVDEDRKKIEQLEKERDQYKRLWELRGEALAKGCPKCGYVQARIKVGETEGSRRK